LSSVESRVVSPRTRRSRPCANQESINRALIFP
jgi:hypothetical protein